MELRPCFAPPNVLNIGNTGSTSMFPKLIGVAGPLRGNHVALQDSEISIGRDPSNHLWVMDPALSRRQCQVVVRGETFVVHDLDSRNGTMVNGVPVKERELQHGDQILVGNSVLVFMTREEEIARVENPVEMTETSGPLTSAVRLRPEDGLYENDEKMQAAPSTDRLARDLNSLLRIAKGIGGIRDRDSLQWQLLGLLFDVVPAERAAIL